MYFFFKETTDLYPSFFIDAIYAIYGKNTFELKLKTIQAFFFSIERQTLPSQTLRLPGDW